MVVAVGPSVANCLLATSVDAEPSQRPLHVRRPSQLYTMEPLYATVQRKQRPVEHQQQNSLEAFYGGKYVSNRAAFVIQKSFRAYRLQKQFSRLLSLALSEERLAFEEGSNEINVDTGLPMLDRQHMDSSDSSPVPDNIDLLILQAAGLETLESIVKANKAGPSARHIKNRRDNGLYLKRTTSLRMSSDKKAAKKAALRTRDDCSLTSFKGHQQHHYYEDEGPSPPPEPCPALKGQYEQQQAATAPRPPQRTVSFLSNQTLPNKINCSHQHGQQRPLPPPPAQPQSSFYHMAFSSDLGLYNSQPQPQYSSLHSRSYSSPAPLSPNQGHIVIEIPNAEEPLPPPPYISPPDFRPLASPSPPMPSPPPPPPPMRVEGSTRPPCDSSSSASSVDSGFRSSFESPTNWMASPNLICSPDSHNIIKDVVFEPRQPQSELLNQQPQESVYGQRRPPQRNYSILKKKKSVRINDSASETAAMLDEVARRRQYRVGLNLFNQSPDLGIEYLLKKDFLDYSPASVGKFLRGRKGLSKMMIGNYLCQLQRPFNLAALHCFVHEMDFSGLHLDIALRHLYAEVTPPTSEAQKVEKIVEVFAKRYIACNQMFAASFKTSDSLFVLAYAVVLLNTDLHTKALRPSKRMKREDFVANLRGIDLGQDLDTEMLQGIYDRIKANELKAGLDHVSQVARVEETIIHKKKVSSPRPLMAVDTSRRLVCFCRLTEVPELHKKAKLKAEAGQRGVFLFNDVLVVTKTVTKKDKTLHQFKYRLDLNSIRINVFSTAQYQFGVQLQDRLTGKVSATFNSRSEADQQRFVNDLQESVAEMAEMARAKSGLNEVINGNNIDQEDAYETLC